MKKKIFSILFALVLVLSLSLVTAVPVAATTINVDDTMTTTQINAAIAGSSSVDVVQFADGTYNLTAPLVVGVAGVTLQGDTTTPSNVVINAPTSGSDKDCFQVKANNVTIQGFNIKGAISATSGNGWQNAGIMLGGDYTLVAWLDWPNVVNIDGGTFQNNIIDGCSLGIYMYESKNISVLNNTIENSTTLNHPTAGAGIMCWNEGHQDPVSNTISGNIIKDNARIGICFGRWAARASCSGTIIQNNTITGNGDTSASGDEAGITLMWMDGDITITGNTISGNTYGILAGCDGYASSYCTGVVAHFNTIENNDKSGTKLGIENRFNPAGDADQIDAENNWWGDCSGPSGVGPGTGDSVSANVDYDPWLCSDVDIDIKPGSDPNSINPNSKGLIAVAILGSATFDVTYVDVITLKFGPAEATPVHDLSDPAVYAEHLQDVNGDTFTDLVSHYRTQETVIVSGVTSATLNGTTTYGMPITGTDSVRIVGKP